MVFIPEPGISILIVKTRGHFSPVLARINNYCRHGSPVSVKDPVKISEHPQRKLGPLRCIALDLDVGKDPFLRSVPMEYFYQFVSKSGIGLLRGLGIHFSQFLFQEFEPTFHVIYFISIVENETQ